MEPAPIVTRPLAASAPRHSGSHFGGLRGQLVGLVLGVTLLIGLLASWGIWSLADQAIHRLGAGYAVQYARQQQARVLARIEREVVLAQKLVNSPLLQAWAVAEQDPDLRSRAIEELESFRRLFADGSYFFVVDASKNYYFNNAANEFAGQQLRYSVRPDDPRSAWYFQALKNTDDFVLHVDNSPQLGLTKVWINAVVRRGADKVGMGGSGIELGAFLEDVVQSDEPGVETLLVSRDGTLQGHSDRSLMERNAQIKEPSQRLKVFELFPPRTHALLQDKLRQLVDSPTGLLSFEMDLNGRNVIVGAAYLQPIDWLALVVVDPRQAIGREAFLPIVATLGLALLASALLLSYALDRLLLRRLTVLTRSTREIAAGHYSIGLEVDRQDEIGQLTQAFNEMAATIHDSTRNLEQRVEERTDALRRANLLLEEQGRTVKESLQAALALQTAMLANPQSMRAHFPQYFAFWRPRDIVGGDYYALYPRGEREALLAVVDCTGHGIPGALMAMASKALLDRLVASLPQASPAQLLVQLHDALLELLPQTPEGHGGGLEIGLLQVDSARHTVTFAGARIPLWLLRPGQALEVLAGDRLQLGCPRTSKPLDVTERTLQLPPGTRGLLFSDGLLDQPGGAKGFGLGQRRWQEALQRWENVELSDWSERLESFLQEYAGPHPQRDDIVVVGFQLGATR